jgi:methylated-DNA-[protein]-cysteine S-methyltransferase
MRKTSFQKKVYEIVRKIPGGKTATYKEIAEKLDTSPRAVGQALKRNKDYKKIPCHRVIKSDKTLGGYNRGMKKKRELLKKEGAI